MARWITVRQKFDFTWPSRAITHFSDRDLGEHFVKDELADFAVAKGYADEGKLDGSNKAEAPSKPSRRRKGKPAAKAADSGPDDAVAEPDMADPDRSADGQPLDPDAE